MTCTDLRNNDYIAKYSRTIPGCGTFVCENHIKANSLNSATKKAMATVQMSNNNPAYGTYELISVELYKKTKNPTNTH